MKFLAFLLTVLSQPAFAISPCTSKQLKQYECSLSDTANGTRARVILDRSVTTGGSRPYCSNGVVQESVAAYAYFHADAPAERVDLLFPVTKPSSVLSDLEAGLTANLELYSAGSMLEDVHAPLLLSSRDGVISAELNLEARIISVFSREKAPIAIRATGTCVEQR